MDKNLVDMETIKSVYNLAHRLKGTCDMMLPPEQAEPLKQLLKQIEGTFRAPTIPVKISIAKYYGEQLNKLLPSILPK